MAAALAGLHAVVTGGGTGIGAAIAAALAAEGARLTLMGRRPEPLQATAAALPEAEVVPCDVTDEAAVEAAFAAAAGRGGPVALLVNNAGAVESAPLQRTSLALFRRMLEVNLTGAFLCSRAALPGMIGGGFGRIVNVASTAGLRGYPYVAAYCAAKHGLVGLTRALALELAKRPVTVNAVCPGYTDTALVEGALDTIVAKTGRSRDEASAELVRGNPQGRLVQPAEVAAAVAFLCRPENAAITGQALAIAGGEVT